MSMTTPSTPTSSDPSASGAPATDNPIIEGLIEELPPQHSHFSVSKRLAWIECFEAAAHLIWHPAKRLHVSTTPPASATSPTPAPAPTDDDDDDDSSSAPLSSTTVSATTTGPTADATASS